MLWILILLSFILVAIGTISICMTLTKTIKGNLIISVLLIISGLVLEEILCTKMGTKWYMIEKIYLTPIENECYIIKNQMTYTYCDENKEFKTIEETKDIMIDIENISKGNPYMLYYQKEGGIKRKYIFFIPKETQE